LQHLLLLARLIWASIVLLAGICRLTHLLSSSIVVCNAAGGWADRVDGPTAWAVGRPTLYGGPVRLRPVRATPCFTQHLQRQIKVW